MATQRTARTNPSTLSTPADKALPKANVEAKDEKGPTYKGVDVTIRDITTGKEKTIPGAAYDLISKETVPFGGRNKKRYVLVKQLGRSKRVVEDRETGND